MSRDETDLFRALFEASVDAQLVVDDRGVVRRANASCERLFGYAPSELEGQPIEVLVPERFGRHRHHRAAFAAAPRARPMGTGVELFARRKDGSEVPIDISLTPLAFGESRLVAVTVRDLRTRPFAGEALRVQATALRSAANGVVITDRTGTITWVNPAACAITGYGVDELVGKHTRTLKSGRHPPEFYAELWRTVLSGETWSGTIVNRRKDGTTYHEEQTIAPVVGVDGAVTHFIAIKQDVTARHAAESALAKTREDLAMRVAEIEMLNAQLREQAIRDPLTGLYNRRYFHETIERDLCAASATEESTAILAVDVDHFKRVNDTHGHAVGDQVLVALGGVIERCVAAPGLACRFGGEEFVIVLPGTGAGAARARAEELRVAFATTAVHAAAGALYSTISIGVSAMRAGEESIDAALARADHALYDAKRAGRDRVVVAHGAPRGATPPSMFPPRTG